MKKIILAVIGLMQMHIALSQLKVQTNQEFKKVADVLKQTVMTEAAWAMQQEPETVTAAFSIRSAGGLHDFYSEGDYWWPNPQSPDSPYVQRDGMTNPENFVAHRKAMIRFSRIVGALASAYLLTEDEKYAQHALRHCRAWFVDTATMMNPHLLFAQAIKGRVTGRGIGIIDTIHLMEVAQGLRIFSTFSSVPRHDLEKIKQWFEQYLNWLTTHPYGRDEMNALNNHGTCWVMQVASFASFTGNQQLISFCENRYKTVLLPGQMAADGSFPLELKRTKPYGYSIFNLDAMAMICQVLSWPGGNGRNLVNGPDYENAPEVSVNRAENRAKPEAGKTGRAVRLAKRETGNTGRGENLAKRETGKTGLSTTGDRLWEYIAPAGQSIKKGIGWLYPFLDDKNKWPFAKDVMYWNEWPVAQPALLFGALKFNNEAWFNTWSRLDHSPENEEVIRNLPIRNPLIWLYP